MIESLAFLFGLLIGSFLNVCIYRMPRDLSVVRPRSRCNGCERMIAWYDNIPLVSFALLGARCRHCGAPISWRYPLVELLTGLIFAGVVWTHGVTPDAARLLVFSASLIALFFTDLETRILPDEFTLGGFAAGLAFAAFVPLPEGVASALIEIVSGERVAPRLASVAESLLGALLPAAVLWLCGFLYERLRGREGLGFGDVKMTLMIGSFLGLAPSLLALVAGSLSGSIIGLILIAATRRDAATYELPLGSFLACGGLLAGLFGEPLLSAYFRWNG